MKPALPITDRPIRFALVGCGRISVNHVEALRQHVDRAQLVAVCDVKPDALAAAVQKTGAQGFASLDALLAHSDAEVVVLATPSGLHPRQAMQAARAGRHVLSEKPMATKWDEGMAMVRECRDAGVKLFVVKQNRLNPTMQQLKAAIDQGRFGRIVMCNVNVFWTRPQSYYDEAPWRGRWDMDGGAFLNQASHYVDMLDWLIGPVDSVHAYTASLGRVSEAEDTGVMSLRLRRGALASINVTMLTHGRNFEGSITLLGERGTVRIGYQPRTSATAQQGVQAHYRYRVMQPLCAALYKSSPALPGGQDVIVLMVQPLSEEQVIAHCLLVYHDDGLADTGMIAFQQMIFGEDKPLLESQRPRRLPLEGPLEAHMRCDLTSTTYRRWLKARGMRFGVHSEADA